MRYLALATDYDGTLAHHGAVAPQTLDAVQRLKDSGRKVVLVTGRVLEELLMVFPGIGIFDLVVTENGAALYDPKTNEQTLLCDPPSPEFVDRLRSLSVQPLSVGKGIVATWSPNETVVLETIKALGLELQVIFNKGAVMVLPSGVNKATGLAAALTQLELSPHNVVAVGDAENDHAFLAQCECSVAVANALDMLKQHADLVTKADHGDGVGELIEMMLADDLATVRPRLKRHEVLLGEHRENGTTTPVCIPAYNRGVLIAGPSQSGKSTVTMGLIERICQQRYQFVLVDPEGDYDAFAGAVNLGDTSHSPSIDAVMQVLCDPAKSVTVNLLAIPLGDRPLFFSELLSRLMDLRVRTGRPHWIVVDEAHHLFPASWVPGSVGMPPAVEGMVLITNLPDQVARIVLEPVEVVVALGAEPMNELRGFAKASGKTLPFDSLDFDPEKGDVALWRVHDDSRPQRVRPTPGHVDRRRHTRKYAEGELPPDRSFYFRGPGSKLNLRAYNLQLFSEMAHGIDDETWEFHRKRGDYSAWFHEMIKDEDLTREARAVESEDMDPKTSRALITDAIQRRYGGAG